MENNDLKNLNKQIEREKEYINEQNKKLYEIDGKLDETENHMKVSEKYISGLKNFFGFFPKLFYKSKKNNDEKEVYKDSNQIKIDKSEPIDNIDDADILNKNAKELRDRIKRSSIATDEIETKIDKNNKKLERLNNDSHKMLKSDK